MGLKWTDTEEIAILLHEQQPDLDPLAVRFTELRDQVCGLPDFDDDPAHCGEAKLEAIQMAWLEEYQDALDAS